MMRIARTGGRLASTALGSTLLLMLMPAVAAAQSPVTDQYFAPTERVNAGLSGGPGEELPFTGFDPAVLAVVAIGLIAIGLLTHRMLHRPAA